MTPGIGVALFLAITVLSTSIAGWTYCVVRLGSRLPALTPVRPYVAPWGLWEFAMMVMAMMLIGAGGQLWLRSQYGAESVEAVISNAGQSNADMPADRPVQKDDVVRSDAAADDAAAGDAALDVSEESDEQADEAEPVHVSEADKLSIQIGIATVSGAVRLLSVAFIVVWILFLDPAAFKNLGVIPTLSDLRIGLVSGCMIIPPVLLLHQILSSIGGYDHQTISALKEQPPIVYAGLLTVNAVFLAPLQEEVWFRALLQGGLQRFTTPLGWAGQLILRSQKANAADESHSDSDDAAADQPTGDSPASVMHGTGGSPIEWGNRWWPLAASAVLFGAIHLNNGWSAFASLTALSLGIGYVFQQTGRIWPAILIHMLLNSVSVAATQLLQP